MICEKCKTETEAATYYKGKWNCRECHKKPKKKSWVHNGFKNVSPTSSYT